MKQKRLIHRDIVSQRKNNLAHRASAHLLFSEDLINGALEEAHEADGLFSFFFKKKREEKILITSFVSQYLHLLCLEMHSDSESRSRVSFIFKVNSKETWIHGCLKDKRAHKTSKPKIIILNQWFLTFLLLWPFHIVFHVVIAPNHKVTWFILHNCNFVTLMSHNLNISVYSWSQVTSVKGLFNFLSGQDL